MFFSIKSDIINKSTTKNWVIRGARLSIAYYRITPAQKPLELYIKQKYGLNLKTACLTVLAHCNILKNQDQEFIITFPDKRIDQLASTITYGNGKIQGCSILKEAFMRE